MNNDISLKRKQKKLIEEGQFYAPLFYQFINWLLQDCEKKGIEQIYFFTREGEFFYQIADKINNTIKKDILDVSRVATFCPSLREVSINEMMRIWNLYNTQSMNSLCKSLGLDVSNYENLFKKYSLPLDELITNICDDTRIKKLFNDKDFINILNAQIQNKRKELSAYFKTKNLNNTAGKIAIVDIGWRGTIQDNICYLLPNKEIYGYYFGLYSFFNEQPKNSYKYGFLNQYSNGLKFLDNATPLEMLCNSSNGSVIGYKNKMAIRKIDARENESYESCVKYVQMGILQNIKSFQNKKITNKRLLKILNKIVFNPNIEVAKAYFKLKHNAEFGIGDFVSASDKISYMDVFLSPISKKHRRIFKENIKNSTWNNGYLKINHLGILNLYFKQRKL